MLRSRCWVHHLDFFQEPCVIVRRGVPRRVVSTADLFGGRQLTNMPFPAEFIQSLVSVQHFYLAHI